MDFYLFVYFVMGTLVVLIDVRLVYLYRDIYADMLKDCDAPPLCHLVIVFIFVYLLCVCVWPWFYLASFKK
jgi:hypothetical protein